jgi:hypothetical protein
VKKIIFLFLVGLLVTEGVLALPINRGARPTPVPMPVPTPVIPTPTLPVPVIIEERIREIEEIDKKIDERINETTRAVVEIVQEAGIRNEVVEELKEGIKEISDKAREEKEIERTIEKKQEQRIMIEQKIETLEKEVVIFERAKPEVIQVIQREIEKIGIEISPKDIQEGMRRINQDRRGALGGAREKRVELEKEIEEATQKRETVKEELEKMRQGIIERVREVKEETMPLIEEVERIVREERELQLIKIAEIERDSDGDGLSDRQEIELGTDILNPDTDGDKFLDGIEKQYGFNPFDPRREVEIIYQDPREVTPRKIDIYIVENVRITTLPDDRRGLEISGRGLPNSELILFIFSEPVIVSVRTDGQGRWSYVLEDPRDGKHEIFAVIVNNRGETEARSLVFPFVLAGENIAVLPHIAKITAVPLEEMRIEYLFITLLIITVGLIAGLIIIKILTKKEEKKVST